MSDGNGKAWTTGKILAVVIPICVVVAAVAVTLVLVLGKSNSNQSQSGQPPSNEEILKTYDDISKQAQEAMSSMNDLQSQDATSDPQAYEQQVAETQAEFEEVAALSEEAANSVIAVSDDYADLYAQYEELYNYIYDYYAYIDQFTQEAISQLQYLESLAPTLQEVQQLDELTGRLKNLPATGQAGELSAQLTQRAQKALANLQSTTPPSSMGSYGSSMESLTKQINSITQQMTQALGTGNKASFNSLADQLTASIGQIDNQLSSTMSSLVSGYTATLSQMASSVTSALP